MRTNGQRRIIRTDIAVTGLGHEKGSRRKTSSGCVHEQVAVGLDAQFAVIYCGCTHSEILLIAEAQIFNTGADK